MNHPLPGIVWIQLPSATPAGCSGREVDGGRTVRVGVGGRASDSDWLPARGNRCGVTSSERVWLSYSVNDQNRASGMSGGKRHGVRLGAVEVRLVRVHERDEVLAADPGEAHGHGRRDPGVAVEEQRAQVVLAGAGRRVRLDAFGRDLRDRASRTGSRRRTACWSTPSPGRRRRLPRRGSRTSAPARSRCRRWRRRRGCVASGRRARTACP